MCLWFQTAQTTSAFRQELDTSHQNSKRQLSSYYASHSKVFTGLLNTYICKSVKLTDYFIISVYSEDRAAVMCCLGKSTRIPEPILCKLDEAATAAQQKRTVAKLGTDMKEDERRHCYRSSHISLDLTESFMCDYCVTVSHKTRTGSIVSIE